MHMKVDCTWCVTTHAAEMTNDAASDLYRRSVDDVLHGYPSFGELNITADLQPDSV